MLTSTQLLRSAAKLLAPAILALALLAAYRADRRARSQLAADLTTARQALAQLDARHHDRDAQLQQTLATLAADKRTVTTPHQILRELPKQIPLPAPIFLPPAPANRPETHSSAGNYEAPQSPASSGALVNQNDKTVQDSNQPQKPQISARNPDQSGSTTRPDAQAILPQEDLKPLYDFALDCQACQAKLAASQADLADEKAKAAVLTRERDEAVRIAKGGSTLRRVAKAAKWFALGALAGAIATHATH
jgi:hypothetical protein